MNRNKITLAAAVLAWTLPTAVVGFSLGVFWLEPKGIASTPQAVLAAVTVAAGLAMWLGRRSSWTLLGWWLAMTAGLAGLGLSALPADWSAWVGIVPAVIVALTLLVGAALGRQKAVTRQARREAEGLMVRARQQGGRTGDGGDTGGDPRVQRQDSIQAAVDIPGVGRFDVGELADGFAEGERAKHLAGQSEIARAIVEMHKAGLLTDEMAKALSAAWAVATGLLPAQEEAATEEKKPQQPERGLRPWGPSDEQPKMVGRRRDREGRK